MEILNSLFTWVMKKRIHQMELFMKYPHEVQGELFNYLIEEGKNTEFGKKYHFKDIKSYENFKEQVPLHSYEEIYPYIKRLMQGEQNILWPSEIKWFAKSSGTTGTRSKFIPVSTEALEDCHFKGGKDLISLYVNNYPETKMFTGKGLAIGGSHQINNYDPNSASYYGDVSAVIMANLPFWAQFIRTPKLEIALMDKWEEKIEKMADVTVNENVTSLSGVPTWTVLLLQRILEMKGKSDIKEIWPNLEAFFHGAVAFTPYQALFNKLISQPMNYVEIYNASEGFFGIQDQKDTKEMLLMLDYGIFYEFIPFDQLGEENPTALRLDQVEKGKTYAMVISTNAGLWRYNIGDTVKFTSIDPYRIIITGRTKHFINAFGEEVVVENAENAITHACEVSEAIVSNFTAAPVYLEKGKRGGHEWIIEFTKEPTDLEKFTDALDEKLREINSDYDAKRQNDLALVKPKVHKAPEGTFYNWMKQRGKLGGQNKVPRLANNRDYIDDILKLL